MTSTLKRHLGSARRVAALRRVLTFIWTHPLNAQQRVSALGRFARWQIASRLSPGPVAIPFVEGTWLVAEPGMAGATGNWYCGLHEYQDMAFVLHVLRPHDHFLDIGANIGSYTLLAGGAVGARVTSLEPAPETFSTLKRNVLINGLEARVRLLGIGVSDRTGVASFTSGLDAVNHIMTADEAVAGTQISVSTIDEILTDDAPTVIKIDVEGHEKPVLEGARRTLSDPAVLAVLVETNGSGARYGNTDSDIHELMASHGFKPFFYEPRERRLRAGFLPGGNTIFVRSVEVVQSRLSTSRRYKTVNAMV